jgi:hypothetical protein
MPITNSHSEAWDSENGVDIHRRRTVRVTKFRNVWDEELPKLPVDHSTYYFTEE